MSDFNPFLHFRLNLIAVSVVMTTWFTIVLHVHYQVFKIKALIEVSWEQLEIYSEKLHRSVHIHDMVATWCANEVFMVLITPVTTPPSSGHFWPSCTHSKHKQPTVNRCISRLMKSSNVSVFWRFVMSSGHEADVTIRFNYWLINELIYFAAKNLNWSDCFISIILDKKKGVKFSCFILKNKCWFVLNLEEMCVSKWVFVVLLRLE